MPYVTLADILPKRRSLATKSFSLENHHPLFSKSWYSIPPEPDDKMDDIEDSVSNKDDYDDNDDEYGDGTKWGKPSDLGSIGQEESASFMLKEETENFLNEVKNGRFKALVEKQFRYMGISCYGNNGDDWVDTVTSLSWEAASYLRVDGCEGKEMDPNRYVKVKCIATGSQSQSEVFKGLVFKKNAIHKRMPTKYRKPKLLLIKGALCVSSDGLLSFESMTTDSDKVESLMGMIEKLDPNIILVEKYVSRDIQESILAKGMTLVLGMTQRRLERVARCTGSPILSFDNLNDQKLRQCDSFYFDKIVEEHADLFKNGKKPKSIMFLKGCPGRMGVTLLLKGTHKDELKRIKHVVRFAFIMAYHLICENSFILNQRMMFSTISPNGMPISFDDENVPISWETDLSPPEAADTEVKLSVDKTISCEEPMQPKDNISAVLDTEVLLVLMSTRNVKKRTTCMQSSYSCIKFYQSFDVPLGKLLQDNLLNRTLLCGMCNELPEAHHYYYAHHNKKLIIQVKRLPLDNHLSGGCEGKLWMWSCCGQCKPHSDGSLKSTKRVLISAASRGLSFGKYLKLGLLNHSSLEIPSSCGHSFYKDYFHFFGLGSMVAIFGYSTVATYSVSMPPLKIKFSYSSVVGFLKEEVENVFQKGHSMFAEAENSLEKMENKFVDSVLSLQGSYKSFSDIKEMLKQERDQFQVDMKNLSVNTSDISVDQWWHQPLYLNHIKFQLLLHSYIWDERLYSLLQVDLTVLDPRTTDESVEKQYLLDSTKGWMWKPFSEIQNVHLNDLQKGYSPKYEPTESTICKIITKEGSKVHFQLKSNNHIVSEYEDELSSMIACALAFLKDGYINSGDMDDSKTSNWSPFTSKDTKASELGCSCKDLVHPVIFMGKLADKAQYSVACLYPQDFLDLRGQCGLSGLDYISSLSHCKPWDAKGGKSKSFFAKTLDDRFIIKEIQVIEFCSFVGFASDYFGYMNDCFKLGNQTCLAKILGIYKVNNLKSGVTRDLMVMENITYFQKITRQYDLKGALYTRLKAAVDGAEDVLLDQNFVNDVNDSPIYVNKKTKWNLQRAVWNDTAFLESVNVMDYSLLVGMDVQRKDVVCGIIDYVRQYTNDKKLESLVKSFVVPRDHLPTIIPPNEYKNRFRKFITSHIVSVPNDWCS